MCVVSAPAAASESRFLAPAAGDVLASGVTHEVRWESPCLSERDGGEKEVLLSVDGGRTFPIRVTAELPACAMSFRWKIPAVSSDDAQLAVRVGRDGHPESEEIAFVSAPFRITAYTTAEDSELTEGTSERWTEQALHEIGAEGLLDGALRGSPDRLEASSSDDDLDETALGTLPAPAGVARRDTVLAERPRARVVPPRSRRSIPLPLRE